MHKERAVKFWMERDGLDRMAALQMWDSETGLAKFKDDKGPAESRLRIPVKLDDFLIMEDSDIYEKEKLLEHKRVKFSEEQDLLADEALQAGRAATSSQLERLGVSHLEAASAGLVGSLFGSRAPVALAPSAKQSDGLEAEGKPVKAKTFDAGVERLALQDKLVGSLDKEVNSLLGVIGSVRKALAEPSFEAALHDDSTPTHEVQAMKMMKDRKKVAEALVGSYRAGQTDVEDDVATQDAAHLSDCLANVPAELPDIFSHAIPVSLAVKQLVHEVALMTEAAKKKELESDWKPIVNLIAASTSKPSLHPCVQRRPRSRRKQRSMRR